ncbi:Uracil-DNA glycosylase, family 1, partial [hydrothermal vent metagenome]
MTDFNIPLSDSGWREALKSEFERPDYQRIISFLRNETARGAIVYPPKDLIFNAFNLTPLSKVKVVILGQDPYHGPGQAMGLSFSVPAG